MICSPGRGPNKESFIDTVRTGTCAPGREPGFDTMVKGANARAGIGQACASKAPLRSRHRDGIYVNGRPSSTPAGCGTTRRQADLQAPLGGSNNALECLCHDEAPPDSSGRPERNAQRVLVAIRQNLPRKHRQPHNQTIKTSLPDVRPADRTEWPNRSFHRTSPCHAEVLGILFGETIIPLFNHLYLTTYLRKNKLPTVSKTKTKS